MLILLLQVTLLKCGGIIVACTFDHRIADAYSANMFLVSWAKMAYLTNSIISISQISPFSMQPCFQRTFLSPKHLGLIDSSLYDMYIPMSKLPQSKKLESNDDQLIS